MKSMENFAYKSKNTMHVAPRMSLLTPKISKALLKAHVISFDIFDTLLLRPYLRPSDLFRHIEKEKNKPSFYNCRITAEKIAHKNTKRPDVTLDEIYDVIDNAFKHLKKTELELEQMVLRPNPQMMELFQFARQNHKRIVITSDMYLPSEFIAKILHKNGFDGYEKLYVSCDIGATKSKGTLFDYIIQDMQVRSGDILHIGDNYQSDYKQPRKHGIRAIHYITPVASFIKNNQRINKFVDKTRNDLGASILIAMLAYRDLIVNNDNYWYNLGYEYGGPAIYGYTRWIEHIAQTNNIKHLMFIARDGWTLQRVFKTFNDTISNAYVYAPRFLNLVCRLDYKKGNSNVALAQQKAIIDYYKTNSAIYEKWSCYDFEHNSFEGFIESNFTILKKLADSNFKNYEKYILKQTNNKYKKIGLVDTITENFSAQNLITAGLIHSKFDITGLYWQTLKHSTNKAISFRAQSDIQTSVHVKNWGLMEFLMTSPEYPIEGIDKNFQPIYKKHNSDEEKHIRQIYPHIADGCLDFAHDVHKLFNNMNIYLTYDTIVHWINSFCVMPYHKDFMYMETIKTSSNPGNDVYDSLFRQKLSFFYKIRHPIAYYKKIKSFMWLTPVERLIICITHPINIDAHRLNDVSIYLLPKLKHRIFGITMKICKTTTIQIILGAKKEI